MYCRSYANFCSQPIAFRPLIWARPVRPGFAVWRIRTRSSMNTMSRTSWGRGPTNDISPRRMLNISGSSSRLVPRRNLPKAVSRSSSGRRLPAASFLSVIVRNLYMLKIFSLPVFGSMRPGRGCRKITGEPIFTRTSTARIRYSQLSSTTVSSARRRSSRRFITFS